MSKRDELLKEAMGVLLAADFEQHLVPHPELGLWDNEVIAQYETRIQSLIDQLPGEYGEVFVKMAYKLEDAKEEIGLNRSIAHALAVEIAVHTLDCRFGNPNKT